MIREATRNGRLQTHRGMGHKRPSDRQAGPAGDDLARWAAHEAQAGRPDGGGATPRLPDWPFWNRPLFATGALLSGGATLALAGFLAGFLAADFFTAILAVFLADLVAIR